MRLTPASFATAARPVETSWPNFLVVGDQDFHKFTDGISSSKMKAAQRHRAAGGDIELISEDDFLRMLEPVATAV
jgi:hypothetical protein